MPCDPEFFATLRKTHRIRQFAMGQRKSSDFQLGALLRQSFGWSKQLPAEDRDAIAGRVSELIATGEKMLKFQQRLAAKPDSKAKIPLGADDPDFIEWSDIIMSALLSREPMDKTEAIAIEKMEALASELPAAIWFKENVFKGSLLSLAIVIAETGDLTNYATVSKVWKRMGVAVMDGVRQGGLTKGAKKELWIAHGYVARRRSQLFVIGDALIKGNEHYRKIYHAEKERQTAIAASKGLRVVPAADIKKGKEAECMSKMHVHRRAQRYMEKEFLRDLWVAWNGKAIATLIPIQKVPSQPFSEAA